MNMIDLKERIAIGAKLTPEQISFTLDCINAAVPNPPTAVDAPRNYMGRIDFMWAYLSLDDGGEGVCAIPVAGSGMVPMIAADRRRLDLLRPYAKIIATTVKRPVRLAKFKDREDIELILPGAENGDGV